MFERPHYALPFLQTVPSILSGKYSGADAGAVQLIRARDACCHEVQGNVRGAAAGGLAGRQGLAARLRVPTQPLRHEQADQ